MSMSKVQTAVVSMVVLLVVAVLVGERRARTRLREEVSSLRSDMQRLSEQVAARRPDQTRLLPARQQTAPPAEDQAAELSRLRADLGQLLQRLMELEGANAALS